MMKKKYINGEFLGVCQFQMCANEFTGRLNQLYCSAKCKNQINNQRARKRKLNMDGFDLALSHSNDAIRKVFKHDDSGECIVSINELIKYGFDQHVPYIPYKCDESNRIWKSIGVFAFIIENQNVYLRKIKKQ